MREAEYVMAFVRALYDGIRPLLFSEDEKLGVASFVKFFSVSVVLFLILNAISKVLSDTTHIATNIRSRATTDGTFVLLCVLLQFTYARAKKFVPQKHDVINKWRCVDNFLPTGSARDRHGLLTPSCLLCCCRNHEKILASVVHRRQGAYRIEAKAPPPARSIFAPVLTTRIGSLLP